MAQTAGRYTDAVDGQLAQIRFWRSPAGVQAAAVLRQTAGPDLVNAWSGATPATTAAQMARTIEQAVPVYVAGAVDPLLRVMATSLPSFPLQPSDLIAGRGWAWFETPLPLPGQPDGWPIRACLWEQETRANGIDLVTFVEAPAAPVPIADRMLWWPFGWSWDAWDETHAPDAGGRAHGTAFRREFAALVAFTQQRIAAVTHRDPDRAVRRRAQQQAPGLDPTVRVVELRRRAQAEAPGERTGAGAVSWQHQWIVRGFWRNQWYPSEGRHRPKWINPYVKGPRDKPLKVPPQDVFVVDR